MTVIMAALAATAIASGSISATANVSLVILAPGGVGQIESPVFTVPMSNGTAVTPKAVAGRFYVSGAEGTAYSTDQTLRIAQQPHESIQTTAGFIPASGRADLPVNARLVLPRDVKTCADCVLRVVTSYN